MNTPKTRKPLTGVLLVSISIHALFLFALGGMVVFRYFKRAPIQFATPPVPVSQRIEPRKLEYKVRMQESQKKSGRPTVSPRMTAASVGAISLPEIKSSLKPTPNKILSNLSSFGTSGLGDGLGGGTGSGGLGLGMSGVSFFGIVDRGERIAFLVDVSLSMLEDEKGGIPGFEAVKSELTRMVRGLSQATFFNIYMFATGVDAFQPKLSLAKDDVKDSLEAWLKPYNRDPENKRNGNLSNNYTPSKMPLPSRGGTSRMDLALNAAFEQGADTIFILSDGAPLIYRPLTDAEQALNQKELENWEKRSNSASAQKLNEKLRKKFEEDLKKETESRARRGLPPKIVEGGRGYGVGAPTLNPTYNHEEIIAHIEQLYKSLYEVDKKKRPHIHCVGYSTDPGSEEYLKAVSRAYQGRFRRIKSLVRPIKS